MRHRCASGAFDQRASHQEDDQDCGDEHHQDFGAAQQVILVEAEATGRRRTQQWIGAGKLHLRHGQEVLANAGLVDKAHGRADQGFNLGNLLIGTRAPLRAAVLEGFQDPVDGNGNGQAADSTGFRDLLTAGRGDREIDRFVGDLTIGFAGRAGRAVRCIVRQVLRSGHRIAAAAIGIARGFL